jgi:hypothetical protein
MMSPTSRATGGEISSGARCRVMRTGGNRGKPCWVPRISMSSRTMLCTAVVTARPAREYEKYAATKLP